MQFADATVLEPSRHFYVQSSAIAHEYLLRADSVGHFFVTEQYQISRINYDSYLLLLMMSGRLNCESQGESATVHPDSVLLLDCTQPHRYWAAEDSEFMFIHMNGALIEPLSVATHAVRRAQIQLGETVLILGAGAIGMMTAAMCRRSGAAQVIVADLSDSRLEMALQMGATVAINSGRTDLEQEVARLTGGKGVDKSFECVGRESCFLQAIQTLRRNGTATVVGIYEQPQITFPASRLVTHEIHIQGAQGYCWDFPIAIAAARDLPLEKFITHTFPLEQLQQALDTALDPASNSIKVIVKP